MNRSTCSASAWFTSKIAVVDCPSLGNTASYWEQFGETLTDHQQTPASIVCHSVTLHNHRQPDDSHVDCGLTHVSHASHFIMNVAYLTFKNQPKVLYFSGATRQKIRGVSYLGTAWTGIAAATVVDSNADGVADDPAYLVLGNDQGNSRNKVQAPRVSDGARLTNITMVGTNWEAKRVTGAGDISGNLIEEVGTLAKKRADGNITIQLKDFSDRTTTATIFP